ncbi:MAG: DEAD/DEAH box helicase family protein, partial [Clostridia bacterium]|nr:DEAD/DEAH box helicase family protein [Clostridia bacterium]
MIAKIYILDAPYHIDSPFDYVAHEGVFRGAIVKVPFGRHNKLRYGVVAALEDMPAGENIKPVLLVVNDRFSFTEEMLGLCLFLKEHTLCTFGEAARTVLPPGALSDRLNIRYEKSYRLAITAEDAEGLLAVSGRGGIRSPGQRATVEYLLSVPLAAREELLAIEGVTAANISSLRERGLIEEMSSESFRNPYEKYSRVRDTSPIMLTRAQGAAYSEIEELYKDSAARAALLYGVTGSGKTKVIMKAIDKVIADGKSVIMLVPEISLTPQTLSIFCKRYGERVAVIHSSLSQGERLDAWRRIR